MACCVGEAYKNEASFFLLTCIPRLLDASRSCSFVPLVVAANPLLLLTPPPRFFFHFPGGAAAAAAGVSSPSSLGDDGTKGRGMVG